MEINQGPDLESGYQPRPLALPSAGRALSVLVAVCAVLWVWYTDWWPPYYQQQPWHRLLLRLLYSYWTCALVIGASNYVVFRWATRPMWRSPRLSNQAELKRVFVLVLSGLFHLAWLLLLGFMGLLALAFSGIEAGPSLRGDF